jgi:tRNA 2-selenouridine synthase
MPNPEVIEALEPAALSRFDTLIDVRSPSEFAEDHAPGAVNLPVLDDEERARVGTIYVQDSPFKARRLGAALVARNIARHLETALADRPADFRPLVYCWRGGQRSNAMASVLAQVGWRTAVLAGGYRTYRRRVQTRLYEDPLELDVILLDGGTGSGKTEVLDALGRLGVQTVDLEGLAEHRGSLLGALPGRPQPSQKMFESRLLAALEALDASRPVVLEAESSKIGDRMIPPALWRLMVGAPRIELQVPRPERARYLVRAYADLTADTAALKALLARLPRELGRAKVEELGLQADAGEFLAVADALMELHYDPAYARSGRKDVRPLLGRVAVQTPDDRGLARAAEAVAGLVAAR